MCLAVPGKLLAAEEREGSRLGRVEFGGIVCEVCLDLVPEAVPGDYVIVHAGFALSRLDAEEAEVLSDRVGIIDHGKFIAFGTPRDIVDKYGTGSRVIISKCDSVCIDLLKQQWPLGEYKENNVIIRLENKNALAEIIYTIDRSGGNYDQIQVTRPTLEDVFLRLTGRKIVEKGEENAQ